MGGFEGGVCEEGGDKERKESYKKYCANGDKKGLDPLKWSILDVNEGFVGH